MSPPNLDQVSGAHRDMAETLPGRIQRALTDALGLVGLDTPVDELAGGREELSELTELALDLIVERLQSELVAGGTDAAAVAGLVLELHRDLLELHANAHNERLEALINIQDALSRLRGLRGVGELIERVPTEICRSCDFDRVLLFRVEPGSLALESLYANGPCAEVKVLRRSLTAVSLPLTDADAEAEVIHGRAPLLLSEATGVDRSALARATRASAIMLVPVVSEGEVVGLLAADRSRSGRSLQRVDRDSLAAFASGLGYAVERAVLLERLHAQRDQVLRLVRAAETVASELCDAQIRLSRADDQTAALAPITTLLAGTQNPLAGVLSPREIDVMEAMTSGATNGEIAERLSISEDTVKSHVKRILAKLGASNRVEAVSHFVRLVVEAELRSVADSPS